MQCIKKAIIKQKISINTNIFFNFVRVCVNELIFINTVVQTQHCLKIRGITKVNFKSKYLKFNKLDYEEYFPNFPRLLGKSKII